MKWFSSRMRLVCLIEGIGATRYTDSVCIFKANNFEQAKTRALALGKKQEEDYKNKDGELVRWRLKALLSIDFIECDNLDGVEVYSEPVDLADGEAYGFDQRFSPEYSEPTQTI